MRSRLSSRTQERKGFFNRREGWEVNAGDYHVARTVDMLNVADARALAPLENERGIGLLK